MNTILFDGRTLSPAKVVCIGRNYVAHINELGNSLPTEPVIFCKPNSSIAEKLFATHMGETLHYETELCFLLQQGQFVAVGLGLDLTKRDTQSRLKDAGLPWERAKAFDGSVVLSRFVPLDIADIPKLELKLFVNNDCRQQGGVEQMLYKPQAILEHVSEFMTLSDNDIIMTGTPEGVGPICSGESFKAQCLIDGHCVLEHEWRAH